MSRLTAAVKVCTCLSKALGRFLVSWLMVANDHLDHETLWLRSGDMANHSVLKDGAN